MVKVKTNSIFEIYLELLTFKLILLIIIRVGKGEGELNNKFPDETTRDGNESFRIV